MKAIWDNVRGLDLLESLPYVRRSGFGAIGHSLGGHNAVYTAAFDQRLSVIVSSCGLDLYTDYYGGDPKVWQTEKGWCQLRYMPRLLDYVGRLETIPFDFAEIIGTLAPRTCFISAPLRDANFRWASVDRIVAAARPVYAHARRTDGAERRAPRQRTRLPRAHAAAGLRVVRSAPSLTATDRRRGRDDAPPPFSVGQCVLVIALKRHGAIVDVRGEQYRVAVGSVTMTCRRRATAGRRVTEGGEGRRGSKGDKGQGGERTRRATAAARRRSTFTDSRPTRRGRRCSRTSMPHCAPVTRSWRWCTGSARVASGRSSSTPWRGFRPCRGCTPTPPTAASRGCICRDRR